MLSGKENFKENEEFFMKKTLFSLLLALCILLPVSAASTYWDPYLSTGATLRAKAVTDYKFQAVDYQLSTEANIKFGGFINPDLSLYGVVNADIPFYSGVLDSNLYGYEASIHPMSWSAGLGLGFALEDSWTIAIEAAADITPDTDGVLLGGTFKVIPTYAIAPAREWFALSLTLPIAISADTEGAGVSFGIGLSLDLNDHAVN